MITGYKITETSKLRSKLMIDSNIIVDTFDPVSPNYDASMGLMNWIVKTKTLFVMPMHGWFEIACNINKIKRKRGVSPPYFEGKQAIPIEFVHIDAKFIENYAHIEISDIKSKDHIFLVIAKVRNIPLITWDNQMTRIGKECGIDMMSPIEWLIKNPL